MRIVDSILQELDQEAATTRRVLERVPNDKLDYRPHQKAMSLGQLTHHIATVPGGVASFLGAETMVVPDFGEEPAVSSAAELLPLLESSLTQAKAALNQWDDAKMMATWTLSTKEGKVVMAAPRIGVVRMIMLNHWYHHRGQLSVYLRALDVPLPSIYGPSADENPFA